MKNLRRFFIVLSVSAAAICASVFSTGLAADPGSQSDPLVSKSYVDKKIEEALGAVSEGTTGNTSGGSADTYVPVSATAGGIIIGHEGTEIILRSGSATAFVGGENGLVNATTGAELMNGAAVEKNNILIIPRFDGRGVQAATDAWFIIKGGYEYTN